MMHHYTSTKRTTSLCPTTSSFSNKSIKRIIQNRLILKSLHRCTQYNSTRESTTIFPRKKYAQNIFHLTDAIKVHNRNLCTRSSTLLQAPINRIIRLR